MSTYCTCIQWIKLLPLVWQVWIQAEEWWCSSDDEKCLQYENRGHCAFPSPHSPPDHSVYSVSDQKNIYIFLYAEVLIMQWLTVFAEALASFVVYQAQKFRKLIQYEMNISHPLQNIIIIIIYRYSTIYTEKLGSAWAYNTFFTNLLPLSHQ